ncbi:MAG: dephospho-CoA kinase [Tatlockia sp.]|nr:dephospho-CoA kinase [Tatlockia sp.]
MFCVGLTGTIASGKSTVTQLFKNLGVTIISADEAARELTKADQPALIAIEKYFGKAFISTSGELDRKALRQAIFSNPQQRIWLEQLLHPLIRQYIQAQLEQGVKPYAIVEIPLLKARDDYPYLDRVLLITSPSKLAIERLMLRDNCSEAQAETILALQVAESAERSKFVDDLIENSDTLVELSIKIEKLHGLYLQLADQKS